MNFCAITDCGRQVYSHLLCGKHFGRAKSAGYIENPFVFSTKPRIELHRKYNFSGNYYKVLVAYQYKCANCGLSNYEHQRLYHRSLHIHHIDRKGSGKKTAERNNCPDNLIPLCFSCHQKIEKETIKQYDGNTLRVN